MTWFVTGETSKLYIKVSPNSRHNKIDGLVTMEASKRLGLRVQAPPDRGRANKAVCALLAKSLGIPKSSVRILAGEKSSLKTVGIDFPLTETDLTTLLAP